MIGALAHRIAFTCLLTCLVPAQAASAQEQFTAKVVEDETNRPVKSTIEYEASPNVWRPIRATGPDGALVSTCPGRVQIRANAWPEFRHSQRELCGGTHRLSVARRPVSVIATHLPEDGPISLHQWVQANASVAISEAKRSPEQAGSEGVAIFSKYVVAPEEISPKRRELIETRLLNAWTADFQQVDINRDQLISKGELRSALRDPS